MKHVLPLVLFAAIAITPSVARAHGGEDHGEVAKPSGEVDGRRTAEATTDHHEIMLKFAPPAADGDVSLVVFLSDYATNAPVDHAKIELELGGSTTVKTTTEPTETPGVYHAVARIKPGTYSVIATIEIKGDLDLAELKDVDFTPAPPSEVPASGSGVPWKVIVAAAGGLAALIVLVALVRRRAIRARAASVGAALLLVSMPFAARGHGGEDHGGSAAKATPQRALPPGGVYMAKESQFLLAVRTQVAADREMESRLDTVGRVIPRIDGQATIAAPQPGRVVPIKGRPLPYIGDRVARGEALFVLEQSLGAADAGSLKSQAISARSAAAQARARRDQAQRELERKRSLKGVVADKDIQQAELDLELANRELQLATQQASLFGGGGLQRITITSPIAGTVAEASVSIGQQVAGDQVVYKVIDASTLWVEANVFEADVPRIEQAGTADVRVEGIEKPLIGKVYRVGQTIDPTTRTVKVVLLVDNAAGVLRPGMFAQVAIGAGGKRTALAIPDAAVIEEAGRRFVFVHVSAEVFVRREVVLGVRDGEFWSVQQGLEKGDRVVTQGTYQLRTSR